MSRVNLFKVFIVCKCKIVSYCISFPNPSRHDTVFFHDMSSQGLNEKDYQDVYPPHAHTIETETPLLFLEYQIPQVESASKMQSQVGH